MATVAAGRGPKRAVADSGGRCPRRGHLTRRGRLAVVVLAVLCALVTVSLGRVASQAAGPARPLPRVTVRAGQTLWGVASAVAPHRDPRATVLEIEALNHLAGDDVRAGQSLLVPRG
ncbi:MAG TPA: LysM peptidoglycan-binding domain-containing protein [Mycobacteriales bacterium]|nr:LysM peptidoglycan-binding domain-containing protein [Mycobacteriales bacterium]